MWLLILSPPVPRSVAIPAIIAPHKGMQQSLLSSAQGKGGMVRKGPVKKVRMHRCALHTHAHARMVLDLSVDV